MQHFTFLSSVSEAVGLQECVVTLVFSTLLLSVGGLLYRRKIQSVADVVVPDSEISLRNIVESCGQLVYDQCCTIIGEKEGPHYFPFACFIFFFVLGNNLLGLVPGFTPATHELNTTLAFGLFSFLYYNFRGMKSLGVIPYLKHFMGPIWYMAILIGPIEIISNAVRPLSLALRLRGNIFGDHLVLGIFTNLVPYILPLPFVILGFLVCVIQAFVFTMLSIVYISLAVAHHDHDEHHDESHEKH